MKKEISMSTSRCTNFLSAIHSTDRKILTTKMFVKPTKISLLNFIGAADHFITDFGAIWTRRRVFPNKFNILTRGFLPLVIKDRLFPYPWVYLPTTAGKIWFPLNQLMGWAFDPKKETDKKYFLSTLPEMGPHTLSRFTWNETIPEYDKEVSLYTEFMQVLYQ